MKSLVASARACTICSEALEFGPRPVFAIHPASKIVIIGQAPGRKVHDSGKPWDDASGRRLREWLGVSEDAFYDAKNFAILPMGFCYPGKGKSGDLPPRPECARQWHESMLRMMPQIELTLLFGQYAMQYYLGDRMKKNLTETVRHWEEFCPAYLPMPHPSPRNNIWLRKHPWFEKDVVPYLQDIVQSAIHNA